MHESHFNKLEITNTNEKREMTYLIPIRRPRIIHQHIQFPKQRHRLLHNALPIRCLGHVHLLEHDILRIGGGRLLAPFDTDIRHDDLGSFGGEALRDGGAETGSGSYILNSLV